MKDYKQWLEGLIGRIVTGRTTQADAVAVLYVANLSVAASGELVDQFGPEGAAALLRARGLDVYVPENNVH